MHTTQHDTAQRAGRWGLALLALAALMVGVCGQATAQDREEEEVMEKFYDFDAMTVDGNLGVTPGGAQDINFVRDQIKRDVLPMPEVFTPEGLFSQHDLPLRAARPCAELLCVTGQAAPARVVVQDDVRYLAQLGFASSLTAESFKRPPLNLVAVVDKSGSMSGQPLELVKLSLQNIASRLGPEDRLTIVLYGDRAHVHLPTIKGDAKGALTQGITSIQSQGSTAMEDGLRVGFGVATQTASKFDGITRVMLFTDERPNVGRTDAASFMGMARAASAKGVGMTTVGVGVQFGAELATSISSVRGGNLFFFPDMQAMADTFDEDFDTMVTELAYDMTLKLKAPQGFTIAGVYGIPGDALTWSDDGALQVTVETLFLSKRKGAIYVALAPTSTFLPSKLSEGATALDAEIAYTLRGGKRVSNAFGLPLTLAPDLGLRRGTMLVNEATALKHALTRHHKHNDQEGAYQTVHALAGLFRHDQDRALDDERAMIYALESKLALLSGRKGEGAPVVWSPPKHPINGLPQR